MNRWYVIQTKPNREDDVGKLLTNAKFKVFNPKIRESCYRSTFHYFKTKPLFPRYLFLSIDFQTAENIHMIKYTRGVSKILCAERKPLAIDEDIISTLQARTTHDGLIQKQTLYRAGEKIRVKKGLLKDLIGIIEKPVSPDERVCVLLKLINYDLKATLHWTEVEKLAA